MKFDFTDRWVPCSFDAADPLKIKLRGAFNSIAPFNFKTSDELALSTFQSAGHPTEPHAGKSPGFPAYL